MLFTLQSLLEFRQFADYATVAVFSAIGYDYILTFSREVDYIWPWNWVSIVFVLVRYFGICWAIIDAFIGSTFLRGTVKYGYLEGTAVYLVAIWTFVVFLTIADLMMILRVYVMWNRSRAILRVLLFIFVVQTVLGTVYAGLYINPNNDLFVTIDQLSDSLPFCDFFLNAPPGITIYFLIPRFVLSAVLLILALTQTLKESVRLYKATKQWQPNRYMKLLVKDGIIYFFTVLLYNTTETILSGDGFVVTNTPMLISVYLVYFLFATIMPRFIIAVRELYIRDLRVHFRGIDTGFGVSSHAASRGPMSAIVFEDVVSEPDQEEDAADNPEVIQIGVGEV